MNSAVMYAWRCIACFGCRGTYVIFIIFRNDINIISNNYDINIIFSNYDINIISCNYDIPDI